MFLEVVLVWGGPRLGNFKAVNLGGPEIHSLFWWRNENTPQVDAGPTEQKFLCVKDIMSGIQQQK